MLKSTHDVVCSRPTEGGRGVHAGMIVNCECAINSDKFAKWRPNSLKAKYQSLNETHACWQDYMYFPICDEVFRKGQITDLNYVHFQKNH